MFELTVLDLYSEQISNESERMTLMQTECFVLRKLSGNASSSFAIRSFVPCLFRHYILWRIRGGPYSGTSVQPFREIIDTMSI